MDKQMIIEFLQVCENVYIKNRDNEPVKAQIAFEIGQVSLAINLSGEGSILKEVIEEYKDKFVVTKYLGTLEGKT